jgi:prenyltransferase beta subunit
VSIPSSVFSSPNAKSPDVPGGVDITSVVMIVSPVNPRIINRAVIAGLDPAIHPFRKTLAKMMDTRVKPAYDAVHVVRLCISLRSFLRASVIAARKCLRVNGGFSEPPSTRKEGGGTPKGAPW